MKKIGFFIVPVIMMMFLILTPRLFASGINPSTMVIAAIVLFAVMMLCRPKKAATKTAEDIAESVLNDFCKDAFAQEEDLRSKFYAALNDIGNNCPKAAIGKLEKLAPLCSGSKEKYAVAMAAALAHTKVQQYKDAIREYNKALVLHPSCDLAVTIGSCHQRLGNLKKALDSYEFATELNPESAAAFSSMATVYVAEGDYDTALDYAMDALDRNETLSNALATAAICYAMRNNDSMYHRYTELAVENGYSKDKIKNTVEALKKRK